MYPTFIEASHLARLDYFRSFPHMATFACNLDRDPDNLGAFAKGPGVDERGVALTRLDGVTHVLTPAACYHIYPLVAVRGRIPANGLLFDVACDCFRHEPSQNVDRLQSFRMREYVRLGSPQQASDFRDSWIKRGREMADRLGLKHSIAPASDPFFGRAAKLMADSQIEQALKFELLIAVRSDEQPTACMSFNCHRDHFGVKWKLRDNSGDVIHTACAAFGMDRLALAMFAAHGTEIRDWPKSVREAISI